MAKKGKDEAPNPHSVSNRDIIQRLNFLYQAGVYMNTISSGSVSSQQSTSPSEERAKNKNKNTKKRRTGTTSDLAKAYISSMKTVGQRTTVKVDPAVKRTICQGCDIILIPGSTASVRVKTSTSHGHVMVYTCTSCQTSRRIPAPPILEEDADITMDGVASDGSTLQVSKPLDSGVVVAMDVTAGEGAGVEGLTTSSSGRRGKLRKTAIPRKPPLFAREVGHVVFCGNDKLDSAGSERGNGIYIV